MDEASQLSPEQLGDLIEESAEDLYENAPCGYISTLPNGIIVRVNSTFLNWLGYTRNEVVHKKRFQELLAIGSKIYYETHFAPLLQMQGFVNEVALDLQGKDKQQLPVLLNIVQLKSASGKPLINRSTLFNITDRKKYERELVQARKKAEEAAKAKADFLSTVSHEIRTPLNAIIGISNLLNDTQPNQRQRELIDVLRFSADNLLNLINDILDFSKIEAGKVTLQQKDINLSELLYSTLYSLAVKAEEKNIQLHLNIDEQLPEYLIADPIKITQIITNLIGNAIKFTDQGSVTASVQVQQQTDTGVELRIAVTDTGIGIPQDRLQQIFEEFTQASYDINIKYGGTGLGLTISQKLLQLYGSRLHVKSQPGVGSEFWFVLFLKRGKAPVEFTPGTFQSDNHNQANSLAGVTLLLAEDNEINVFVIAQFLNKWGVQFDVATNGIEVLEKVQQKNYQLVLMDLQMPLLDGYDASLQIRQLPDPRFLDLPIIALSASSKFDLQERLEIARITDFIGKPFNPAELHALIAHYSKQASEQQHQPLEITSANQAKTGISQTEIAPLDLSQYLYLTEGDPQARKELFGMTIQNLRTFLLNFRHAIQERNASEFRFQAHKIKMTLDMLKAIPALNAINQVRLLLMKENTNTAELTPAAHHLEEQLNLVINGLVQSLE